MKIKKLSEDAANWLKTRQYTESTVYINYVRFWNGLVKSAGDNTDFSRRISINYVIGKYDRDILSQDPQMLPPKEYRIYRAFRALEEFHDLGVISGTSMAEHQFEKNCPSTKSLYSKVICSIQRVLDIAPRPNDTHTPLSIIIFFVVHFLILMTVKCLGISIR